MTDPDIKDASSPSERRGTDRKKLIVDVRFEGGDGTGIANTRDIGSGGLYMTTTAPLEVGVPILMSLSIGERSMSIHGTVVYSDPGHGVGVRFRDLSHDDESFLTDKMESL